MQKPQRKDDNWLFSIFLFEYSFILSYFSILLSTAHWFHFCWHTKKKKCLQDHKRRGSMGGFRVMGYIGHGITSFTLVYLSSFYYLSLSLFLWFAQRLCWMTASASCRAMVNVVARSWVKTNRSLPVSDSTAVLKSSRRSKSFGCRRPAARIYFGRVVK